jgi:hypothetical protein
MHDNMSAAGEEVGAAAAAAADRQNQKGCRLDSSGLKN